MGAGALERAEGQTRGQLGKARQKEVANVKEGGPCGSAREELI